MAGALEGITVVDLGTGPASALATMFLSDHGARVIRVIDGSASDFREGGFVVWDRGKDVVRLDIDSESGAKALGDLLAGVDVLVEDFAPSSPRQKLVAWEELRARNPRLVACSITAYGKRGIWKDEPPIEDLIMARTGLLGGLPGFRPAPVHTVHPLPSVGAALLACNGIAAAVLAREDTGRGRAIETSLMAGALLYMTKADGEKIKRHVFQTIPSGSAPFYSLYECADGKWVQLGCVHEAFIAIAAGLFGLTELIKEPRMVSGRAPLTVADDAEMRARIAEAVKRRPLAEWAALFETADVPFAPAQLTEEGFDDPQVRHNGMVVTLEDPAAGPIVQMGVPVQMTGTPGTIQGPRREPSNAGSPLTLTLSPGRGGYAPVAAAHSTSPSPLGDRAGVRGEGEGSTCGRDNLDPPPLSGVRILEITNLIAGPTAGRILADLGAEMIKLEPPTGDLSRPIGRTYFYAINFNKRSIAVDTSKEEGRAVVQRIAATCDALLANLRPKATERMGISTKINPRLIETHLTGYGFTGPYSKRPGIDPLAQAYMGMSRAQGGPENPPVFPAQLAPTDYTNGAMGAFGTIMALYVRKRTGVVQNVYGNLLSAGILLSSAWFTKYRGRPTRQLADKEQMGLGPFHRLYQLADGWIYVVAETEAAQQGLCRVAGVTWEKAGLTSEAGRHPNSAPIAKALEAALSSRKAGEVLDALKAAKVPAAEAPAGDAEIFLEHPHALANDMVAVRAHPTSGQVRVQWRSIRFTDTALTPGRATPLLGEHSAEVLKEAGYTLSEIEALLGEGIVKMERVAVGRN